MSLTVTVASTTSALPPSEYELAEDAVRVGASFTAETVSGKDWLLLRVPSDAVTVITLVPTAFETGEIVMVQFGQVPPNVKAPLTATIEDVAEL